MRILILDDDPMVSRGLERMLRRRHTVTLAREPKEALAILHEDKAFDAILCDLHLAGTTGRAFYGELSRAAPELVPRVVFMTGGTTDPGDQAFLNNHLSLTKPFNVTELEELLPQSQ